MDATTTDGIDTLWARWHDSRDDDTRGELVRHYLPLVTLVARTLARSLPVALHGELESFGAIGLMDAVDKFRPELGHKFETYGSCRIRGAMKDGLRTLSWFPRNAHKRAGRVIETIVPVDFQTLRSPAGIRLEDTLADRLDSDPCDGLLAECDREEVARAIDALPSREALIVRWHYFGKRRLADIGKDLGITESRVCQLHRRALTMLEDILTPRLSA